MGPNSTYRLPKKCSSRAGSLAEIVFCLGIAAWSYTQKSEAICLLLKTLLLSFFVSSSQLPQPQCNLGMDLTLKDMPKIRSDIYISISGIKQFHILLQKTQNFAL